MRRPLVCIAFLATLTACGGGSNQATADSSTTPAAVLQLQAAPSAIPSTSASPLAAKAVDLTDAIAILKMIVGLEVNAGGAPLTAYQANAADVDGNGKVELSDAISVLKRIVGLETATANWMFFNGAPTVADKQNPGLPASVSAAVSNSNSVSMTTVLRGDVVSSSPYTYSWALTSKPTGSSATLASTTAANPSFKADVAGSYVATMTITDGSSNVAAGAQEIYSDLSAEVSNIDTTLSTSASMMTWIPLNDALERAFVVIGDTQGVIKNLSGTFNVTLVVKGLPLRMSNQTPFREFSISVPKSLTNPNAQVLTGPGLLGKVKLAR